LPASTHAEILQAIAQQFAPWQKAGIAAWLSRLV
jgi:hypothetical protein